MPHPAVPVTRSARLARGVVAALRTAACAALLCLAAACDKGSPAPPTAPGTMRVVATTELVADLVRSVGGPRVQVVSLIGPGMDPHTYKPGPGDVRAMNDADIVFFHGLHLEGRMDAPLRELQRSGKAFAITDGIPPERLLHADGGEPDPHVWFDPELWSLAADHVAQVLTQRDPEGAPQFQENLAIAKGYLSALDHEVRSNLSIVPAERRVLATAHDAFGYFGRRYDFDVLGVQGISTDSEASLRDIAAIVEQLAARGVPAVFIESTVPPRTVQALVEGAEARGHALRIGGELYSDAPGAAGSGAETLRGMSLHNALTIARALGGAAK